MTASDNDRISFCSGIRGSTTAATLLFTWDAVLAGTFMTSFFVCPLWFLISVVNNVFERPGWKLALVRTSIPVFVMTATLINYSIQCRIAAAHAAQVVTACEDFSRAMGTWPETLEELVPRYLPCIPRAKYCVFFGEFVYYNQNGLTYLVWYTVPPFGLVSYNRESGQWTHVD